MIAADRAGRRFSEVDADMLQAFADQAALAIENARLYEQARRRQREAEVVAELTHRMNASLDLQTTLERLVEGARELCDGDIARIVVREPVSGRMLLCHQVGVRWTGYYQGMAIEPGAGSGGIVLLTGKPFRTDSYADDRRISDHYVEARRVDGTVSQIVVPIPGESGVGGLLYVDRPERRPFTDADEAILVAWRTTPEPRSATASSSPPSRRPARRRTLQTGPRIGSSLSSLTSFGPRSPRSSAGRGS